MTREEYFICLESYLKDLSMEECKEALEYYQNYFDEAGPDKEEEVIEKLGSPKQLAATILNSEADSENVNYGTASEKKTNSNTLESGVNSNEQNSNRTLKIVIAVLVFIIAFPVLVSLASAILGIACGLIFGGLGLTVLSIGGIVGSIILMFKAGIGLGTMILGVMTLLLAIGLFFMFLFYIICKYLVPVCIKGVKNLWKAIVK